VFGLSYPILKRQEFSVSTMLAIDMERTKYKEVDHLPKNANVVHVEGAHLEDHNTIETFTEVMVGVELNYSITKHLSLNVASRLNTYGAFTNGFGLYYNFGSKKQ